jgi:demethylmenaquinone methyltransferase/2-methoxy-6-polyprenyl-1,4-benzoquinol methylase
MSGAGGSSVPLVHRFFSGTGLSYDTVVKLWTLGLDIWWKHRMLAAIPQRASRILDQASGTGILTFAIARRFPRARVVGVEMREEYLEIAERRRRSAGPQNVEFLLGRAEDMVLDEGFDCVTSSYLAKYADLDLLIANIRLMLRPGGVLIMHDFAYPPGPLVASALEGYFRLMRLLGSPLFPEWRTVFRELPDLLRATDWVDHATRCLERRGFEAVARQPLLFGIAALVKAVRPSAQ